MPGMVLKPGSARKRRARRRSAAYSSWATPQPRGRGIVGKGEIRENGFGDMKGEVFIAQNRQPPGGVHGEKGRRQMLLARKDIHGDRLPFEAEQPQRQPNLVAALVELVIVEKQHRHQFIYAATPGTAGP